MGGHSRRFQRLSMSMLSGSSLEYPAVEKTVPQCVQNRMAVTSHITTVIGSYGILQPHTSTPPFLTPKYRRLMVYKIQLQGHVQNDRLYATVPGLRPKAFLHQN